MYKKTFQKNSIIYFMRKNFIRKKYSIYNKFRFKSIDFQLKHIYFEFVFEMLYVKQQFYNKFNLNTI